MAKDISSQVLKGILQGIMLMILEKHPDYGYGLSKQMNKYGLNGVPKGTIYPLLTAMEKRGLIEGKIQKSAEGPDRKYYFVTYLGKKEKETFIVEWQKVQNILEMLISEEK